MNQAATPGPRPKLVLRLGSRSFSIPRRFVPVIVAAIAGAIAGAIGAAFHKDSTPARPWTFGKLVSPMGISLALWLLFSIYWEVAAKNASAAKSAESKLSRGLHLLLVNAALVIAFWPFAGWPDPVAPRFTFPRVLPSAPFLAPIGLVIQAGFVLLAVWARRHLGQNWSGAVTLKVDHELVRSGPYRRIRHPIYTGVLGMYLGNFLVSGRLQGLLAIALVAIAYVRKIGLEERNLRGEFGPAFDDYRRESWAFVPWVF